MCTGETCVTVVTVIFIGTYCRIIVHVGGVGIGRLLLQ